MSHQLKIRTKEISSFSENSSETYILLVQKGAELNKTGQGIWNRTDYNFTKLAKSENFTGEKGQLINLLAPSKLKAHRILVFGIGSKADKQEIDYKNIGGIIAKTISQFQDNSISIIFEDESEKQIAQLGAGLHLRLYSFDKYKTKKPENGSNKKPNKINYTFLVNSKTAVNKALKDEMAVVEGTLIARDLVNEPSNMLGPVEFSKVCLKLSDLGMDVKVLDEKDLKKLGMGAFLAVGQGSSRPSKMVVMSWLGGKKNDAPIVIIGKGVVFDSGGISIKPASSMQDMKGDMGGAAAVVGLMNTIALRKSKANIIGIVGLCENMPDGDAYRPGDIIKSMSGQTIEVINTDAEGRLVLADVLWYAQDKFKPKFMVNLATLTGAIMVGLGTEYAGLFSNDDALANDLLEAGQISGEKLWRMPLDKAYDKMIDSQFADMKNTGGRYGGAITAAQFLQRFVNDVPWAHLDIAGTGFGVKKSNINQSWAPGFGVALLDSFLRKNFEK
ncbi:MAG: leucyl aminopeptidase [Devosiaceae bacterium]|nr:leucyl aminopeptidase [Devosiaceae bacterium]